ncbi:hypothetical protein C0993_006808 [Termitomyces sp. T159_Od127]|nr:hypothetical protein C0993_006808 [Termitomyces sp. T159_Od127]
MCHRRTSCSRVPAHARKPTVAAIGFLLTLITDLSGRWLIDTDKDEEGLRVLADLHGGDLNHPAAKAEFREIKEKVIHEVRLDFFDRDELSDE